MLNEFHSNNRSSTCSDASKSTTSSHGGIRFDRPVGHEFASNILVADLAIRSTAYKPPTPPPALEEDDNNKAAAAAVKGRRRVTFNMDDIQIQTIPAYDSTISLSSTSSLGIEEDLIMSSKQFIIEQEEEEEEKVTTSMHQEPPPAPPISQPSASERISKKASYDALQKRKQYRRDQQQPTIKPGYWYPLASTRTHMMRHPLPTMRSLEMTEKLINESIQREIALNPNLSYTPPSPSPSPHSDVEEGGTNKTITMSVLISDTEDEEEEDESTQNETKQVPLTTTTNTTASNTVVFSEEEEEEAETKPHKQESDFTRSIYEELAKRHSGQVDEYQPTQLLFPFEQNLIPISANKDVLIISPPPSPPPPLLELHNDEEEPIWIDHPSLLINANKSREHKGLFFVKILNTEALDFPIDNDATKAFCTVTYKGKSSKSKKQTLSHSMQIQHEFKIEDIDPDEQIAISIHVEENIKKSHTNNHWYQRIRSTHSSDLERYIHEKDGALCQTSFLPSRFIVDGLSDQTATLMLVNHWYRPSHQSKDSNASLLRSASWKKKRTSVIREKAVGKIYIQCLYIMVPKQCDSVPQTMEEAIEALNAKRFHQTDWQSGYLSQLGGNTKILKKRYFTLTGGSLFAYSNHANKRLLYKIPLTRARKLICDDTIIAESTEKATASSLLNQLDSMVITQENDGPSTTHHDIKNAFSIVFNNGESIQFSCDTIEERSRWISVLEVIICKLPKLPEWIIS